MLTTNTLVEHERDGVVYYAFESFERYGFVRHGFSTRLGGVSEPPFDSMNLSFTRGDDPARVHENFQRFCRAIGVDAADVVISQQEHHTHIRNVTAADRGSGITRDRLYADVDGLLTDEPNVVLCTQYADCVPLFFLDPVKHVVGASHAGWRGTVAGIGAITVDRMVQDYGCRREDILAGIGPSIGRCCFEVDDPVHEAFSTLDVFDDGCVTCRGDKFDLDLWEVNRRILRQAGVLDEHLTVTDLCTRCHPDVFWSHRVTGAVRGSLAGMISLSE